MSCLLSLCFTTSQVHCLEDYNNIQTLSISDWQVILDENNKMIGQLYNGGFERDFINYDYPNIKIFIKRNQQDYVIDLESADLRLRKYNYNLNTNTRGEYQEEIQKSSEGNYFEIVADNLEVPFAFYYTLIEYDEQGNYIEHEFDNPIVGYKTAGTAKSINLNLNITTDDYENRGFFEKLIGPIAELLKELVDFIVGFPEYCLNNLAEAFKFILIPDSDFLEEWTNRIKTKVDEKVPILSLPLSILQQILTRNEWNIRYAGMSWSEVKFMDKVLIPAGGFDFATFAENNEAIAKLREYSLLFTDFILCMLFIKYLRRKSEVIFGKD